MPSAAAHITRVELENFKAFSHFSLHLQERNILLGPNNAGKSTIISALRALDSGIRTAQSRPPSEIFVGEERHIGWRVPENSIPMSLENVHTNYTSEDSIVRFFLDNRNQVRLIFPAEGGCLLIPDVRGDYVYTASAFKKHFPLTLSTVPVLGPLEHREALRERETVIANLNTHRASRNFRSFWYYFKNKFEDFAERVSATWPGMRVHPPELDHINRELAMFCEEGRLTRELFWVGFGFQIWCQLLTHLARAANSSLFVVDEPETYLHPDVQRQLVGLVREAGVPVLLATHSTEIISEADPNDLVYIDKARATGERLKSVVSIQTSLEKMGSGLNITLTALARSRKVIFMEGEGDYKILRRFASRLGLHELSAGVGLTMLPSGGFGSWRRVTTLADGISDVLGAPLTIAAVYDRDYFCDEEVTQVKSELSQALSLAHVHNRKEIENYLLVPCALSRAIERATRSKQQPTSACYPEEAIRLILHELTEAKKQGIQSQFVGKRIDYLRFGKRDTATLTMETMRIFEERWSSLDARLEIVPGKEILADLRAAIQQKSGISLSHSMIIESTHRDEIPEDLVALIRSLDQFRSSPTPRPEE